MGGFGHEEGDAISLRSIDIVYHESDLERVETRDTDVDVHKFDDMSYSLTSHAQRMSGRPSTTHSHDGNHYTPTPNATPNRSNRASRIFHQSPRSWDRTRAGSPLGRKLSTVLHNASARIVNLSNDPPEENHTNHLAGSGLSPTVHLPMQKEYFSSTRSMPSPHEPKAELQGHSLGVFSPINVLRTNLLDLLLCPFTEPVIMLLIVFHVVVLTLESSISILGPRKILPWGRWTDWALLTIFTLYSAEFVIRSIVSGFVIDPSSDIKDIFSFSNGKFLSSFVERQRRTQNCRSTSAGFSTDNLTHEKLGAHASSDRARERRMATIVKRAYLRHSLNRIDFVSIVSFWVYFGVSIAGTETTYHIFIFKALSCLRILRLLNITQGTSTILRSLKKSAPLLVNVAFFVGFFWVFIAVIGVQAFKGSFRRQCVWVDPTGSQANQTQNLQFCGGQWVDGKRTSFLLQNWQTSGAAPKGYICPEQSWCVQNLNPYNGTVHFDNIFNSMELVFVIMSSNTFTDLMYYTMDSDYFGSASFFIVGTLILTFWLMSLVIAVVTTSFQVIRAEQHSSAFAASVATHQVVLRRRLASSRSLLFWEHTRWFWVALVGADIATQAFKTSTMSSKAWNQLEIAEMLFTFVFLFEILCRFACHFPNWRGFSTKSNFFDLFLAIVTSVIQVPVIKHSGSLYRWLTIFQILRSYRIMQAIPFTRELLLRILGSTSGLFNLVVFLLGSVYMAALVACQLIRGDAPETVYGEAQEMTFKNIFNAFVAMYQIVSSENWTQILYAVQMDQTLYHQAWIGAIFFIVWFVFAQNIVMSMFIAVLQENLEVSEEHKRQEQVRVFVQKSFPSRTSDQTNLTMFSLLRNRRSSNNHADTVTQFGSVVHERNVREFLDHKIAPIKMRTATMQDQLQGPFKSAWNIVRSKLRTNQPAIKNPFADLPTHSAMSAMDPTTMASEIAEARETRTVQQSRFLLENPNYDKALWLLGPEDSLRRVCQRIVAPAFGERRSSTSNPMPALWYTFTAFMYLSTVAIVVLACIVTPIYQKSYQIKHNEFRFAWFTWSDLAFTIIFSLEFLIKIVADGFWLTPNGYFRNTWNRIDMFVLVTLWINLIADILDRGGLSRAFRAFKALRALRLVNISDATKATFHDVLIAGFWNIAGASIVSLALLIPMAIWGLNMFAGLLFSCNDSNVDGLAQCYYEFASSPMTWDVWAPRAWENPQVWSFDSFGRSLLILFEIVSQEGWINVMTSAMAITGKGDQPVQDSSAVNAVFFIIFNLLGAVFVLTLFIAVIIQNYSERSGVAYMTTEQRSWQEMRLLLKQARPSRRPVDAPRAKIRRLCYFAVKKHSAWNRFLIAVYCAHVILLMTDHFPEEPKYAIVRNSLFLAFNLIYLAGIVIRIIGLGFSLWLKSRWNIYNLVVVPISITLTIIVFRAKEELLYAFLTVEKLFLVLVAMNLIPAFDSLDQLFKTTVGSLSVLVSLMATWLVLFVTFAIAFNQIFGLTKIGNNGSDNINVRTIPKALVLLFRMSCGEGWNSIMHDYAIAEPYCTSAANFFDSDCGSESWAYFLFISWNIISMYIFVNIVISLVYNNFSYVYQRSGKMSSISREEIRNFKATWAEFDDGTGHIPKSSIARFLSKLNGAFEVRIYPAEYSVASFKANCRTLHDVDHTSRGSMDSRALNAMLRMMDIEEIRSRRASYKRLYTELMQRDDRKGISFTVMLLVISHNKFVDENKSLGIAEFLHRRSIRSDVDRALSKEIIVNFFKLPRGRSLFSRHTQSLDMRRRVKDSDKLQVPFISSSAVRRSPSPPYSPGSGHAQRSGRSSPGEGGRSSTDSQRADSSIHHAEATVNALLAGSAWSNALEVSSLARSTSRSSFRSSYRVDNDLDF